jgi:hypothetical protein
MDVARSQINYQENKPDLARIKNTIRKNYDYWKHNIDRFNEFRRFVFESTLKEEEITLLMTMSMPQIEFNVLEAYVSRLLGEFSKQEPDIAVSADDEAQSDPLTIKVVEQHLRHTLCDATNEHTRYEIYKDLLSGGFSVLKVCTDYANPMSMNQVINIERVFDPTLCGFDQITKFSHKGDGRFCYELFPMAKEEFIDLHPNIPVGEINFRRDFAGFNWSYLNDSTPTLIIADYYEKKKKRVQICQLRDGRTIKMSQYNKMLKNWGELTAPPAIVGKRMSDIDQIVRYRMIENRILEYVETDYSHFPLIFVDGNSILVKTPKNGNVRQVTRPYVYNAKGAQRMKNYAGISLANQIENIVQHKFIIKKEALPKEEEWLQAIKDPQKPSNIVVNAFYEENPDQPILDPIREIMKVPAPPEIAQGFQGADSLIQNILGSYDASLGINNNQLSGIAIVEAASQSNAAAMPYIVGFLQGLQRAAQVYVDLIPKYYTTPRTLPIMDEEGKRSYVKINQEGGFNLFYDSNALNVTVKAGASFQVQKSRTIMMTKEIMGMSPLFAQFMAEKGLPFILDNMEGKGIEQLKKMTEEWLKELQQQKEMAMKKQQQEMQNNPVMMKVQNDRAKIQLDAQKHQGQLAIDMAKLKQDEMKVMADLQQNRETNIIQTLKSNTERFAKMVDLEIKRSTMHHNQRMDHHDRIRDYQRSERGEGG